MVFLVSPLGLESQWLTKVPILFWFCSRDVRGPRVRNMGVGHNNSVTGFFIVIAALVVLGAALAMTGRWGVGITATDRPGPPELPQAGQWSSHDVANAKFRVGLRGYRMEDVDAALASVAQQLRSGEASPSFDSGGDSDGVDSGDEPGVGPVQDT